MEKIGKQYPTNPSEAEEILADALIKYRTEAKHPAATTDPEARHYIINHLREFFRHLEQQGKLDFEALVKAGKIDELFKILADHDKKTDLDAKVSYEIGKLIPHEKEPDFYQNLIKAHGQTKELPLSPGEIAEMGSRDRLLGTLIHSYQCQIHNLLHYRHLIQQISGSGIFINYKQRIMYIQNNIPHLIRVVHNITHCTFPITVEVGSK